ncbi:Protein CBG17016 [Caenorhabditis briggsae]|uniref:Protein CBG17016 n=1 Tax=Caenorhabditis briggsae TaxID=6238 RepID=A8XQ98_CAEBR|nr:Protein CBG17016 [Caenorhabditis briggsae]CAP34824.2 Protein CBG17016 [Caenorhabditis briggsae]
MYGSAPFGCKSRKHFLFIHSHSISVTQLISAQPTMLSLVRKNIVLSPENVKKLVQRCISKELIPVDWKCDRSDIHENLESLLEYSRGKLGMFENVNTLFQALANFLAAPGCANLLQFDGIYMTLPRTHYSIKGGEYIYKTEVLELLSLPIPCPFKDWQADLVRLAMKSRLKCFEAEWRSRFNSNCEMIRVDVGTLKNYVDELIKHSRALSCNSRTCVPPLPDFSNPTIEVESTDGCYEILKSFDKKYPIAKNKTFYARMFSWIATVGIQFKSILEESFISADDSKATVRLFKIGKESYVMAHELLQSMKNKNMDVSEFEDEILQMTNLATFNFREVAQKGKIEDMKNIEFIRINNRESTVTSIPIPAPDDTYCVPSSDALYDLISDMIVAKKVLQRIDRNQFVHIEKFFKIMEIIFPVEGGDFFISLNDVEWIKAKWEKTYEEHLKSSAPVKHIRKVRKGGFTEDDLDKELEYLNLYNCFPEMKREVEWAYKVITQERNSTLKLEDMHSAVFQCQMTVLLENLPNLFKFLHSQKMCMKWVPYLGCVMCEMPRLKQLLNVQSRTEKEIKELMEMTTVSVVPQPLKEDNVIVEEKRQEVSTEIQKKKRSRKTKKSEKTSQATSESPSTPEPGMPEASKESQTCPKCSRASHFADVANEKLRVSKVECKHLKKELANAELEVEIQKQKGMDKDERIRILEEIIKSKDNIIERQNIDLLAKQDTILNFEMEVESKNNIIQEKSTTIKNLEKSLAEKKDKSSEVRIIEPTRSADETEKARDILFKLLEIQGTLRSGNPIGKCRELGHRLSMNAKNKEIEDATRVEVYRFCEQAKIYIRAVDRQLKMIRGSYRTKLEEIPELPEFPAFSRGFRKAYMNVVKSEVPIICQSLLKTPEVKPGELADTDCLICIEEMESEEGTIKCECCNRRYHTECVQEWFKTKRTCPACSSALLDDSEFPKLGQR